jgi:hypothetical protein
MNQSPNTVLSYEPMEVSALNNEFWDGFMERMEQQFTCSECRFIVRDILEVQLGGQLILI